MIVSFLFLAVILALGVSLVNSDRSKVRRADAAAAASISALNKSNSSFEQARAMSFQSACKQEKTRQSGSQTHDEGGQ